LKEVTLMAKFLVIHKLPDVATQDEVIAAGKALITGLPRDTQWLRSWIASEDGRLLCEWEAPGEGAVQEALKEVELFPVEAIYPVETIEPAWFKG